jgi:hypothetical protein
MPSGFQAFDQSGNEIVSLSDRVFKRAGAVFVNTGVTGSVNVPEYGDPLNVPVWIARPPDGTTSGGTYLPNVSISGTTLSYSPSSYRGQGAARPVIIEYGYF